LLKHFREAPHLYIRAATDIELFEAATEAEMHKPGAGFAFVLERLKPHA
jgi:hypothetical protein